MLPEIEFVVRLGVAAVLGSLIGLDRARLMWAAGLRTHMLVCVGACLVMIVSAHGFDDVLGPHVVLDPSRIAAQVVSGIGFLGAGSIILRNEVVKGLTTAASLWTVAAVGLAVGSGLYVPAIAGTAIILIILVVLKPLEERYRRGRPIVEISFEVARGQLKLDALKQALGPQAGNVTQYVVQPGEGLERDHVTISLARMTEKRVADAILAMKGLPSVSNVRRAEANR